MTLAEWIETMRITAKSRRVDSNPNMDEDMDHYRVTLRYMPGAGGSITVPFSMGYGHNGAEPTVKEVLDCLASDASGYENASGFEDWASEYDYDTDSRTAERTYRAVERLSTRLRAWLGNEYERLLWEVERD